MSVTSVGISYESVIASVLVITMLFPVFKLDRCVSIGLSDK